MPDPHCQALSPEMLSSLRELQSEDDPDFVARLFRVFLTHSEEQWNSLKSAVSDGAAGEVAKISHRLKSSCLSVGAEKAGSIFGEIEASAKSEDLPAVKSRLTEAEAELTRARGEVNALPEMRSTR